MKLSLVVGKEIQQAEKFPMNAQISGMCVLVCLSSRGGEHKLLQPF